MAIFRRFRRREAKVNFSRMAVKPSEARRFDAEVNKPGNDSAYKDALFKQRAAYQKIEAKQKAKQFFQQENYPSSISSKFARATQGFAGFKRSFVPQGAGRSPISRRYSQGRGRPAGPSGRYVIPGVGAVGVYEYRKWFNAQLAIQRAQARQESTANIARMRAFNQQQILNRTPAEDRTIPNTRGKFNLGGINQEIDDAANLVD